MPRLLSGQVLARQGGSVVDLSTDTLTYDIEVWDDGVQSVLSGVTPDRPFRNVEVFAADPGDKVRVTLFDDGRYLIETPTEYIDFADCEDPGGGGTAP